MKTVMLIRHAKSSWDDPRLDDFERPLNERGRRDAPRMAQRLKRAGLKPDRLISSPALRAISTARVFAAELGIAEGSIGVESRLYQARPRDLLSVLRSQPDDLRELWLFGHNPGISAAAHRLADCPFDEMPTCGSVRLELRIKLWSELSEGCGHAALYCYPKQGLKPS